MVRQPRRFCERTRPTIHSVSLLLGFIKYLGFRLLILEVDNEPIAKALQDAVILAYNGTEIVPQGPPGGDHRANDTVQMARREPNRLCRTLRISAEHQTSVSIVHDSPLDWKEWKRVNKDEPDELDETHGTVRSASLFHKGWRNLWQPTNWDAFS